MKTKTESTYTPTPLNILNLYVANCRECGCEDVNISFDDVAVRAVNSHKALLGTLNTLKSMLEKLNNHVSVKLEIDVIDKAIAQAEGK